MGAGPLSPELPETCDIAFKEWSSVCDALANGRQSIILRKGGVAEHGGPGRFVPEHSVFWLYPTWVHQAEQGVRPPPDAIPALHQPDAQSRIPIHAIARVHILGDVRDEQILDTLESFHILTRDTVHKRFHYRTPGLWVLAARVCRGSLEHWIEPSPEHAGCKTWVALDRPLSTSGFTPAIDDEKWAALEDEWRGLFETCRETPCV
jgi:hypothetical protein